MASEEAKNGVAKHLVSQVRLSSAYLALVLAKIVQTDVVDNISCADQQRVPVLPEQLEVVRVGLVAKEGAHLICKIIKLEICQISRADSIHGVTPAPARHGPE